jgi:hypothetical protein
LTREEAEGLLHAFAAWMYSERGAVIEEEDLDGFLINAEQEGFLDE